MLYMHDKLLANNTQTFQFETALNGSLVTWKYKDASKINVQKICSYSEYSESDRYSCSPCPSESFTLDLNDKTCYRCGKLPADFTNFKPAQIARFVHLCENSASFGSVRSFSDYPSNQYSLVSYRDQKQKLIDSSTNDETDTESKSPWSISTTLLSLIGFSVLLFLFLLGCSYGLAKHCYRRCKRRPN